mgnify:CR=1 FL=1
MTSVKELLDLHNLGEFAEGIERMGVKNVTDLLWLWDYQLHELKMDQVQINKLKHETGRVLGDQIGWLGPDQMFWSCCHQAAVCSQASSHMAWMASEFSLRAQALSHDAMWMEPQDASVAASSHEDTSHTRERDERGKILEYTDAAKTMLVDKLKAALEAVTHNELTIFDRDMIRASLLYAEAVVDELPSDQEFGKQWAEDKDAAKVAHHALQATIRALSVCREGPLRKQVGEAEKAARNLLVWLVQVKSPLGDRYKFVETLHDAVGFRLTGQHGQNFYSHVMHAHNLEVTTKFPNAFVSNAKHEAIKRKGKRPARTRPPQNAGPEAEAYVPADNGGDEEETAANGGGGGVMLKWDGADVPPPPGLHSSSSSFAWEVVPLTNNASAHSSSSSFAWEVVPVTNSASAA